MTPRQQIEAKIAKITAQADAQIKVLMDQSAEIQVRHDAEHTPILQQINAATVAREQAIAALNQTIDEGAQVSWLDVEPEELTAKMASVAQPVEMLAAGKQ